MDQQQAEEIAGKIVARLYEFVEAAILDARTYEFPIHRIYNLIAEHNPGDEDEEYQRLARTVLAAVKARMGA